MRGYVERVLREAAAEVESWTNEEEEHEDRCTRMRTHTHARTSKLAAHTRACAKLVRAARARAHTHGQTRARAHTHT